MAAYLRDEEGLGSSVGAALLGLCVCCFLPPPSVVVWVLCGVLFCFGKCHVSVCCVFPWQGVLVVTRLHESLPPTVFSTRHVPCSVKRQRGVS